MVACIIEWRHSQNLDKWSDHPPAEHEYIIKVNEFLMYAGLETLFLGLKDRDSHTILFFTLHPNLTTRELQGLFHSLSSKKCQGTERHFKRQID